jgi:hypothetical protein
MLLGGLVYVVMSLHVLNISVLLYIHYMHCTVGTVQYDC